MMPEQLDFDLMWKEEKPFADRLARWIKDVINPVRVVDIGCGPGMYVAALREHGIAADGYDTDDRVLGKQYLHKESVLDLKNPADLVLCFEMSEHIAPELATRVVAAVCWNVLLNGKLIWTAAIPGQGGIGHVNCQSKEYWADMITEHGFSRNKMMEEIMLTYVRSGYHMGWFLNNSMIFDRWAANPKE